MTGDGLPHSKRRLSVNRGNLRPEEPHRLIQALADSQQREAVPTWDLSNERPLIQRPVGDLLTITGDFREPP